MKLFIVFLVAIILGFAGNAQLLIRNTTVVDVEARKLLPGQTVVVEDGKIKAVGKKISVPQDAQVIDGTGKYLLPGFVDAHVHFFQSGGIYTRPDAIDLRKYKPYEQEIAWVQNNFENLLRRYLYAGITTVVDLGATINFLKQRDTFRTKEYAPNVYMAGPLITTYEPSMYKGLQDDEPLYEMQTEEDARSYVQKQLPFKPDLVKIWYILQGSNKDSAARKHLPLMKAVIDEAQKNNLRVAVHAPERIAAQLAVEAGADMLVHSVDDELIDAAFVELLKKKKVVLTPTLVVYNGYTTSLGQQYKLSETDFHYAHPTPLNSLIDFKHIPDTALRNRYIRGIERNKQRAQTRDSIMRLNLKHLVDGGVTIATGTDAGNIGTQHVSSYFFELAAMQQSGLSMWQLLQASTINGAKAVGKEAEFGSIKTGKRADLVLLNKNPLDSISNWKTIEWVINKGVAQKPDSIRKLSPLEVVEMQALAYNAHNLDLYMLTMHDSIQIFRLPLNTLDREGKDSVRKGYEFLNSSPDLYARILNRIVEENMIVDHEEVFFQGATKPFYGIAIYYVRGGKIRRMYFW